MKKCYIAGKIGNLPEAEYLAKFRRAEIAVAILGYEPVNPCTLPHDHDKKPESYLREAIREMLTCDLVYALPCWQDSPGATKEINLAKAVGINVIYEKTTSYGM